MKSWTSAPPTNLSNVLTSPANNPSPIANNSTVTVLLDSSSVQITLAVSIKTYVHLINVPSSEVSSVQMAIVSPTKSTVIHLSAVPTTDLKDVERMANV
jgi:hypothetical protein